MARLRTHLAALAFGMSLALGGGPASALERFVLRLPFLETEITINFADGESAEQLIQASPDLQDLELASGGKLLPLLRQVFLTPLPLETKAARLGHRLVLVQGADHFSLRSFRGEPSPAQVGPVILGWINEQLEVDGAVTFSGGGWGDEQGSLVDVSDRL